MTVPVTQLSDYLWMIDNGLLETDGFGATYVIRGASIALIETGTSLSVPSILAGLDQLGINYAAVEHILLTHIHMDHAGGAGLLAQHLPNAQVYIHSMTAQYLVDPARLLRSVERAVGDLWSIYGTMVPLDATRLVAAENLRLDLGQNILIEALPTPGHSPDHLAFWEARSGTLWCGDAIGIVMSTHDVACAVTPPPTFDLQAQTATFATLRTLPIHMLLPSHFGQPAADPQTVLDTMETMVRELAADVEQGLRTGTMPTERILQRVMTSQATRYPRVERVVRGTTLMSIQGMQRYFVKQAEAAQQDQQ